MAANVPVGTERPHLHIQLQVRYKAHSMVAPFKLDTMNSDVCKHNRHNIRRYFQTGRKIGVNISSVPTFRVGAVVSWQRCD